MTNPAPQNTSAFLTVEEIARFLRVSKMTVYRLIHGGDLGYVQVGRSFRVPRKALHTYLNSGNRAA